MHGTAFFASGRGGAEEFFFLVRRGGAGEKDLRTGQLNLGHFRGGAGRGRFFENCRGRGGLGQLFFPGQGRGCIPDSGSKMFP